MDKIIGLYAPTTTTPKVTLIEAKAIEWVYRPERNAARQNVAFYGRLDQCKGLNTIKAIAKAMPDVTIICCGQGDPKVLHVALFYLSGTGWR